MMNIPILKKHKPVLLTAKFPSSTYTIPTPPRTWQTKLRELEIRYNAWTTTYTTETSMTEINRLMQECYPGPYRVVEKYRTTIRPQFDFELEFDDPKEKTFWLLKNS